MPLQNHAFMYTGGVAVVYYVDGRFEPLGGAHGWFELDASYLFGCTVGPMEWTATTPIPGDMDCSQSLEITDALLIAQSVVSLLVGDPPPCTDQGDTNSDQELDITDALRVAQYVVGLIDSDELVGFRQD